MSDQHDAVRLRDGSFEFRFDDLALRVGEAEAKALLLKGFRALGYVVGAQKGLQVADGEPKAMNALELADSIERLRASGVAPSDLVTKARQVLLGPWNTPGPAPTPGAPVRKFAKTSAGAPVIAAPAKKVAKRIDTVRIEADGTIDVQLFADPREQLRYEIRHLYLFTVPMSQREQWPLDERYTLMDSFMRDVAEQGNHLSRQQIVTAIVDVASGRVNDVNSRRPRPFREGGGDDGRAVVTRSGDGASAWRANVSTGTPAARRIMWWRAPDGCLSFARLASHDDVDMPDK